jgi:hypothetical protein
MFLDIIHSPIKLNSVALVSKRPIPTERPPLAWSAQQIPTAVNLSFIDWSCYFFIQVAPQIVSIVLYLSKSTILFILQNTPFRGLDSASIFR